VAALAQRQPAVCDTDTVVLVYVVFSTEEIRKSIETLDRILDQYDNSAGSKDLQTEKKFIPQQADTAAHMLASCMNNAGTEHKLRKRPPGIYISSFL